MPQQLPMFAIESGDWHSWLRESLPKPVAPLPNAPVALDLFAGCGGLALGFEAQGFRTVGYEMKPAAAATYAANLSGDCHETFLEVGHPYERAADVIMGGPPCQPFSKFGHQRGRKDRRDGFPAFLDAVDRVRPQIVLIENVPGILYRNRDYLRSVVNELEGFGYSVAAKTLNAVHYGTPQNRERVIIVASMVGWQWPAPLSMPPATVGVALGDLARREGPERLYLTPAMDAYVAEYERRSQCAAPRDLRLDRPARTVTCRNLGAATSDMLRLRMPDGRRRRLAVREGARLQGFPDWFEFAGSEYEQYEQIGNAVPPPLGLALARNVKAALAQ